MPKTMQDRLREKKLERLKTKSAEAKSVADAGLEKIVARVQATKGTEAADKLRTILQKASEKDLLTIIVRLKRSAGGVAPRPAAKPASPAGELDAALDRLSASGGRTLDEVLARL